MRTQRIPLNDRLDLIVVGKGSDKGRVHFVAKSGFRFTLGIDEAKIATRALFDLIGVD